MLSTAKKKKKKKIEADTSTDWTVIKDKIKRLFDKVRHEILSF